MIKEKDERFCRIISMHHKLRHKFLNITVTLCCKKNSGLAASIVATELPFIPLIIQCKGR